MALVFWMAVALIAHAYVGYFLSLVAWDSWRQLQGALGFLSEGRDRRGRGVSETFRAGVSLVVSAYNEEACIRAKLDNSLSLEDPGGGFEVLVGSDGSTDHTEALVRACADSRVRLSSAPRAGKAAVLNRCVPAAKGEIVVLTDANTMIDVRALKRLVRHFADPSVGAVCGRLKLYNRVRKDYEESAYWKYETLLKLYEDRHGVLLGANGGLYAIRRSLFSPLPPDTIVDDFVIPLRILEAGFRVRYEPEAVATEETTEDCSREFARRARIGAGNFQSLSLVPGLLHPARGFIAYAFWSHKVLRWGTPALLALALLANAVLAPRAAIYLALLIAQVSFYALALAGSKRMSQAVAKLASAGRFVSRRAGGERRGTSTRPTVGGGFRRAASAAHYFVAMNLALSVGFVRYLRGSQRAAWERTSRLQTEK
jgi:cellulose synthase/poly-beta-1,6-N-acetylglucosamine synthase-like glycosyltransferase